MLRNIFYLLGGINEIYYQWRDTEDKDQDDLKQKFSVINVIKVFMLNYIISCQEVVTGKIELPRIIIEHVIDATLSKGSPLPFNFDK